MADVRISQDFTYEPISIMAYSKSSKINTEILLEDTKNNTEDANWVIKSVEIFCNPKSMNEDEEDTIKRVIYNTSEKEKNYWNSNTLSFNCLIPKYEMQAGINTYYYSINGRQSLHEIPVDYILSYIKITIETTNYSDYYFTVDFYHFFGESKKEIKWGMVSQININGFEFEADSFVEYKKWLENSDYSIDTYPYTIDVDIRRYNAVTNYLEVYSV